MEPLDYLDLDNAQKSFNLAQRQRQDLNEEHRKKLAEYYDKIALYCAYTLSFTVTLIGFLFTNKDMLMIYKTTIFGQPIIYLIYSGWVFLGLALACALVSRKMDAFYVSYFGQVLYLTEGEKFESKRLGLMKTHPELEFVDLSEDELPVWIREKENLLKEAPEALKNKKKWRNFYFWCMVWLRNFSEIGAVVRVGLILIFSILSTHNFLFR